MNIEHHLPTLISAIPTAFGPTGELDVENTKRIMRHALDGGVDSLFVAGTTGEFPALSEEEVSRLLAAGIEVAGPDRVIGHIGGASGWQASRLAATAVQLGVKSLAAITPYYLPAGDDAVFEYYDAVRRAAPGASIFAYLFPDRTGVHLATDRVAALVREFDLAGVKLSGLGGDVVTDCVKELPDDAAVYSGADHTLSAVKRVGGAGVVSGVSAAFPSVFRDLTDAIQRGDSAAEAVAQPVVDRAVSLVGPSIRALKVALVEYGVIPSSNCRMAIDRVAAATEAEIVRFAAEVRRTPSRTT